MHCHNHNTRDAQMHRINLTMLSYSICVIGIFIVHGGEAFINPTPMQIRSSTHHPAKISFSTTDIHHMQYITMLQLSSNNDNDEDYDPRDNFGISLRGLQSSALKSNIDVGDIVVCKVSIPNLGIYQDSSYEVKSIYRQRFDDDTQQIVKEQMNSLSDDDSTITPSNSERQQSKQVYMTLYSPQYHSDGGPVIVTPEEVGLISVRDELGQAAWLALPGFFWLFLAASFFNTYHERTGGSFGDALMGR